MRTLLAATLACLLALPAAAEDPGTITTHATARKRLPNTVADVGIGIETHARTVAAAHKALADGSGTLLTYLRGAGAERLRTEQVGVTPNTETDRGRGLPDRITGYTGQVRVSFRVVAEKLPELLGGVLDKGGNSLEGISLAPREEEMEAAERQLAAAAVRTAMAQAAAVADAAGRRLGAVRQIQVDPKPDLPPRPAPMLAPMSRMEAAAAPIATESGDSEMVASVSVVINLVEP